MRSEATYASRMTTAGHRTILRFRVRVDRVVVMTLTLMSALITYDGFEGLSSSRSPQSSSAIVAILAAHLFAGVLAERLQLGRSLTKHKRIP